MYMLTLHQAFRTTTCSFQESSFLPSLEKQTFPLGQNCNHSHCGKFGKGKKVKEVNISHGRVQHLWQPQLTCQQASF